MSKRNITYVKPEEPSFLKKLKLQVGYKEGPTVDTKRQNLGPVDEDEYREDAEDELPTVVVLNSGDLTAEEASQEKERLDRETENAPADLSTRIVFKVPTKSKVVEEEGDNSAIRKEKTEKKPKKLKNTKLLSFGDEEDD